MLDSAVPTKFSIPWGNAAGPSYIRVIPKNSQIGIQDGAASLADGYPPLTMLNIGAGGVPPFGQDTNGILKQVTQWNQWQAAGAPIYWDATYSTDIGGYPKGAVVVATTLLGSFWQSTINNNTSNPDAGGANWVGFTPISLYAIDVGAVNAASVTLPITITAITDLTGRAIRIKKISSTNTGAYTLTANSFTASVIHSDGSPVVTGELPANGIFSVVFDGSSFQLQSVSAAGFVTSPQLQVQAGNYAVDVGSANAVVVTLSPVPASLASLQGAPIRIYKSANGNSAGVTLTLNGFAAKNIVHGDGSALLAGELNGYGTFTVVYDGASFILQSCANTAIALPNGSIASTKYGALSITNSAIGAQQVANDKLDVMPNSTLKGNYSGGTNTPGDLTVVTVVQMFANAGIHLRTSYYSSAVSLAGALVFIFTHNIGGDPTKYEAQVRLICTATDAGYDVGDVIPWNSVMPDNLGRLSTVSHNADGNTSNCFTASGVNVSHKSTRANTQLTNSKWNIQMEVKY